MIVTLTGENDAARSAELTRIADAFMSQFGDMAVERIDGAEVTYDAIIAAVESLAFLVERKLVILRTPSENKEFTEKFEEFSGHIADTTEVVLIEPKLDKRLSYYKLLKKNTDFRDYALLDAFGLARFAQDYVKEQGGIITPAVAKLLVERIGVNQLGLQNELDKLLSYAPAVTAESVALLTEAAPQSSIFDLLEAAFAGNTKRMAALYDEQRALKVEPQQIIAMLAWQLHILALVKTAQHRDADTIAREAKVSPFVVRKSQSLSRSLTLSRLKELITQLREFDVRTKSEGIIPDEAVRYYLLQLAQ